MSFLKSFPWRACALVVLGLACGAAMAQPPAAETLGGAVAGTDPVDAALQKLDLRGRISQLILATMQGQRQPSTEDLKFLETYPPGGVVVRRILNPDGAAAYTALLRTAELKTGIPLLIGADLYSLFQRDRQIASTFLPMPSMLTLAAAGDEESTRHAGALLAGHLRKMGFDLHLGPSLALSPELEGIRGSIHHLGDNPHFVGTTATTIFQALEAQGVLGMPMQFPGGALNRRDAKTPAVLLTPAATLRARDLAPFIDVIENGARILHVGNMLVPAIDPDNRPASLSSAVMTGLLRTELGYQGVTVAGPLDHADIAAHHDPADAAMIALESGADMLFLQGPSTLVVRVVEKLVEAVERGALRETTINAAARRVLALKTAWAARRGVVAAEVEGLKAKEAAEQIFAVERRAITLLQNRNGVLPLSKERSLPAGVTGVVPLDEFREALEKHVKPFAQQGISTARHLGDIQDFEIKRITDRIEGLRTAVCVFTDGIRPSGPIKLIRALQAKGAAVVVVFLGYPSYVDQLLDADAILLAYCDTVTHEATLRAVADILCGQAPLRMLSTEDLLGTPGEFHAALGQPLSFNVLDAVQAPAGRLPLRLSEQFPAGQAVRMDPTASIKKVTWSFGDGKQAKDFQTSYTFTAPGRYPVSLTVLDSSGETRTGVFHVDVAE